MNLTILIVDDDIATVDVISGALDWEKLGIGSVLTAYNVSEAKELLKSKRVDIVISDVEMPLESGIDLLKWVRINDFACEFLLLTCHEKFTYASEAISYDAGAYLTKPFDTHLMEMTLQKIIAKVNQSHYLHKTSEYGEWMEKNLEHMRLDLLKNTLKGNFADEDWLKQEIDTRSVDLSVNQPYQLVYSKLSNIDADIDKYGKSVFEFILEQLHSEILTSKLMNDSVIIFSNSHDIYFVAVCPSNDTDLLEKCNLLIEASKKYLKSVITCCVSEPCYMRDFPTVKKNLENLFKYNINYFGRAFTAEKAHTHTEAEIQIMDMQHLANLVTQKDKAGILFFIKTTFDELIAYNKLTTNNLYLMKQELLQVVYADLMAHGIQATRLFHDDLSQSMLASVSDSTVDMIRWVNYFLKTTFSYEEEVTQTMSLIEKINEYVHLHYAEKISRTEIAKEFYLTPDYLARMYKKKTGITLKDYINNYRIERAKQLLSSEERAISDIAEQVGFDNYSYFSTLFKKTTGYSPKDYQKKSD